KLKTYLDSGINRLSIGAQSLDEGLLHYMGRVHSKEDLISNYHLARDCGFQNINLDLMFAVPGQTMDMWMDTLKKAVDLESEHISFYSLQLEEGTPFYQLFEEGRLKETDAELDRNMYHEALKYLKGRGYQHYEISNAAKAGYQCRHNLKYWSMDNYLGLGLGAHSYLDGVRFSNVTDLKRYIELNNIEKASFSPFVEWSHINSKEENISEYLFTGMRKMQGICLDDFKDRFGMNLESLYGDILKKYQELKLLEIIDGKLRFTEKGIDISNRVLAEFV
ncbi:MAG: radical SAM family heme chaperone HemW, partial [Bacillota bacterium]